MRKQLTEESELKALVGTQYVFTEVLPTGDDFELFKKVYKITINRDELPRNFIISAKGELIKDFSMTAPQNLAVILQEGIDKTGGLKGAAGYQERLKKAMAALESAEAQLGQSDGSLEPISAILELDRTQGKQLPEVRKAIKKILGGLEKKPEQKALLTQARMLDNAAFLAESKKSSKAVEMYQQIVEKFPDSPGAKVAAEKLEKLGAEPTAPAEEKSPAKGSKKGGPEFEIVE